MMLNENPLETEKKVPLITSKEDCAVIDLFCGVGGITHGFMLEGFKVAAGLDIDDTCRYAYEHNNVGSRFEQTDLSDPDMTKISSLYPDKAAVRILIGCAPCQPFSKNNSKHTKDVDDEKWKLVEKFADIIESTAPDIVSMENVPNLTSFKNGQIYNAFIARLKNMGYEVDDQIVTCSHYGVPQQRKRLVVLASRLGPIELIPGDPDNEVNMTVRSAIGNLSAIEAGETSKDDPLHSASRLSKQNLQRIKASSPGGTWKEWDQSLIADCHKKETGYNYLSVYGRMEWDLPAPTITTQFYGYGNGRFGHPVQNRALSLREGALLQTFPVDYEFFAPNDKPSIQRIGIHVGNAVPVALARAIAKSIAHHLGI